MRNQKSVIAMLQSAKAPDLALPLHRKRFVAALASRYGRQARIPNAFVIALQTMFTSKKLFAGGLAVLAVAASVALAPTFTRSAQAKELVNHAIVRFTQLTPEQRADIDRMVKTDMSAALKEALAAKDLRVISAEEFNKEFSALPQGISMTKASVAPELAAAPTAQYQFSVADGAAPQQNDAVWTRGVAVQPAGSAQSGTTLSTGSFTVSAFQLKMPVTYLRYTDPQGEKTALGLDEDGTPMMKIITLDPSRLKKIDSTHFGEGAFTVDLEEAH